MRDISTYCLRLAGWGIYRSTRPVTAARPGCPAGRIGARSLFSSTMRPLTKRWRLSFVASVGTALRAERDSPGAPTKHSEAANDPVWVAAEGKELSNHRANNSWKSIRRDEVPKGRRIHKMLWVTAVGRGLRCEIPKNHMSSPSVAMRCDAQKP